MAIPDGLFLSFPSRDRRSTFAYMNIYKQVQSLGKSPIEVGGLCTVNFFKREDVLVWPSVNPLTGFIDTAIQMKPGKSIYIAQVADRGRSYEEEKKYAPAGPFSDIKITATLGGTSPENILSLDAAVFSEYGLIIKDRQGFKRLIGNADKGAALSWKYTTGDSGSSRKVQLEFAWQYPTSPKIYLSSAFNITIGGITVTAGSLTLIQRFKVGRPGAPMVHGSDTLVNPGFAGKHILVLADGTGLAQDDGSGQIDFTGSINRHIYKTLASDTITFIGGVIQDEIIEIYAFN